MTELIIFITLQVSLYFGIKSMEKLKIQKWKNNELLILVIVAIHQRSSDDITKEDVYNFCKLSNRSF